MVKFRREFTRPSVDVLWHFQILPPDNFAAKISTYYQSGALISQSHEFSEDLLTLYYFAHWNSLESFQTYDNDPDFEEYTNMRNLYNESLGITMTEKIIELQTADSTSTQIITISTTSWVVQDLISQGLLIL